LFRYSNDDLFTRNNNCRTDDTGTNDDNRGLSDRQGSED
jgi:hypothetical protein